MSMVFGVTAERANVDRNVTHADDLLESDPQVPSQHNKSNAITRSASDALATVERQANRLIISANNVGNNPVKIVDSQKGRRFVILQVPTGAAASVVISHSADSLTETIPSGFELAAGSQPLKIETESAIWAISKTAGTDSTIETIVGNLLPDEF